MSTTRHIFGSAELYDDILRWKIPSREKPDEVLLVDLGEHHGHGACSCDDFQFHFQDILARGITPQEAYQVGLITKLRQPYQLSAADCLSCYHLTEARREFSRHLARAFSRARAFVTPEIRRIA